MRLNLAPMVPDQSLPDALPAEPLGTVKSWLAEGIRRGDEPNPNAMVLATCDNRGHPSARIVLCKDIDAESGTLRFFTNYQSRKGRELQANPNAALVMHWDHLYRQVRVEGIVQKVSAAESDSYFASRSRASQLGAQASAQSQPVESRTALRAQLDAIIKRFPGETLVPRPAHWGGYVLWAHTVELWVEGMARLHDRARWTRTVALSGESAPHCGNWSATRLQP
jgi:pyridoxamine 5'-phosphate oxidase